MDKLGSSYVYLSTVELLWTQLLSTIVEVSSKSTTSVYTTSMEWDSSIVYLSGYACTTYLRTYV